MSRHSYKKTSVFSEANITCPFYVELFKNERKIRCEGFCNNSKVVAEFKSLENMGVHMKKYCTREHEQCPLYKCTYSAKYA